MVPHVFPFRQHSIQNNTDALCKDEFPYYMTLGKWRTKFGTEISLTHQSLTMVISGLSPKYLLLKSGRVRFGGGMTHLVSITSGSNSHNGGRVLTEASVLAVVLSDPSALVCSTGPLFAFD